MAASAKLWARAVRQWHATSTRPDRFGSKQFWDHAYAEGSAPKEWFISATVAATSVASAFAAHERAHEGRVGSFCKVLHVGCGVSSLGSALISALSSELRLSARIMNTDYSPAAVAAAAQLAGSGQEHQCFRMWDAAVGDAPPTLASPLYSCGASSRYDLCEIDTEPASAPVNMW